MCMTLTSDGSIPNIVGDVVTDRARHGDDLVAPVEEPRQEVGEQVLLRVVREPERRRGPCDVHEMGRRRERGRCHEGHDRSPKRRGQDHIRFPLANQLGQARACVIHPRDRVRLGFRDLCGYRHLHSERGSRPFAQHMHGNVFGDRVRNGWAEDRQLGFDQAPVEALQEQRRTPAPCRPWQARRIAP